MGIIKFSFATIVLNVILKLTVMSWEFFQYIYLYKICTYTQKKTRNIFMGMLLQSSAILYIITGDCCSCLLLWLQLENTIFVFEGGCVGRHLHLKTYMENMWKINAQCSDCTWISILYVVMKILQPSSYMQFVLKICSFVCQLDALCLPLLHK